MPNAMMGKKIGMTQIFSPEGRIIPVTVMEVGPCVVSRIKTNESDGYQAVQIAYGQVKEKNCNKAQKGQFEKAGLSPMRYLREVRVDDVAAFSVGQEIKVDVFSVGDKVDVSGVSKGKGFAGTIKRWGDRRGPMGHGSKCHRRPASAGAKGPARIFKGKHSPGRMGGEKVTVRNLEIVKIDPEANLLLVRGAVPGPKKGLVMVKTAVKCN